MTATTPTLPPPQPNSLSSALKRISPPCRSAVGKRKTGDTPGTPCRGNYLVHREHAVCLLSSGTLHRLDFGQPRCVAGLPKFDPSFVILAMEASIEAIFFSTFVLISQNRTSAAADKRADLDLQINLLAEHELTKLTEVVTAIAARLDVKLDAEIEEVKKDVAPEAVLDELDAKQKDN